MLLYGIHELYSVIKPYEKNSLASIFKWLVGWKWSLPRPNFSYQNLSPSPTASYTITKRSKRVFFTAYQPLRFLKLLRVLINRVFLRFHIDRSLYMFLSDRVLLRVFSDRELYESSVIGSSSGSSVIDCSLGSLVLFFWYAAIF